MGLTEVFNWGLDYVGVSVLTAIKRGEATAEVVFTSHTCAIPLGTAVGPTYFNSEVVELAEVNATSVAVVLRLEVARIQANLLEEAAASRRGHGEIVQHVLRRLEAVSERLVLDALHEADGGDERASGLAE